LRKQTKGETGRIGGTSGKGVGMREKVSNGKVGTVLWLEHRVAKKREQGKKKKRSVPDGQLFGRGGLGVEIRSIGQVGDAVKAEAGQRRGC